MDLSYLPVVSSAGTSLSTLSIPSSSLSKLIVDVPSVLVAVVEDGGASVVSFNSASKGSRAWK